MFSDSAESKVVTRIKMAETSDIKVTVKAGSRYFTASKKVQVLENGCGGKSSMKEKFRSSVKIRAKQLKGEKVVQVKAIITHPMHTGQGKDDLGKLIPSHFIQLVKIKHNDTPVVEMQLGTGVSKNPYLTFYLNDLQLGDRVTLEWSDNQGKLGQKETKVVL